MKNKTCGICGEEKKLNPLNFRKRSHTPDKYSNYCRECENSEQIERAKKRKQESYNPMEMMFGIRNFLKSFYAKNKIKMVQLPSKV